ncbi:MAG TPA: hypothetical protein VL574_17610 [Stellaceae bacterium]|jgi:ElaB/YqjD/DUF883 family membrane-anchored ribosome-binding protein|nr:hypothetical protein [Stellaceae bacterium]
MPRIDSKLKDTVDVTEPSWGTVRQDLEALRSDLARLGEKSLADGQERVSHEIERLKANVGDLAQRVSQKSHDSLDVATDYVRKRPLTSVAGAFAIGMVFASLSRRH